MKYLILLLLIFSSACTTVYRKQSFKSDDYTRVVKVKLENKKEMISYVSGYELPPPMEASYNITPMNYGYVDYLLGPVLPIIPIYFFSSSKDYIHPKEKIKIRVTINSRKKSSFKVDPPIIKLSDGRQIKPEYKEFCSASLYMIYCEDYEYPILALENNKFTVIPGKVILGKNIARPSEISFEYENKLDWKLESLAP